jgi:hydrogenase maturation protease
MEDPPAAGAIAVLGIGNALCGDDGLGIHALRAIEQRGQLADHVRFIDGGVMGLDLLPHLEGAGHILILDAIQADEPPGTIIRLEGRDIPAAWQQKLSMHQAGVMDLLSMLRLRGAEPAHLVVWGIVPATIDWSLELSEPVLRSLPQLVDSVAQELRGWGAREGNGG